MKVFRWSAFVASVLFLPLRAFAATPTTFKGAIEMFLGWIQGFIAVLFFVMWIGVAWGVVVYLANGDNETKRAEIKGYLFWAVIGVAVVFSVWSIVGLLHASMFGGGWGIPLISPPS